ncbi:uncharacterized protein SOCEGT47_027690 [Sorangium cellulosum]|uniref:Uncharacterized protein n=1 Tax=Sorangium cellulosum TaxID=56 RepID=A0A4P2Q039_SORCE|nr:uncharacterized protein SOCEGT47_027690 [Sorangium cellulosum]
MRSSPAPSPSSAISRLSGSPRASASSSVTATCPLGASAASFRHASSASPESVPVASSARTYPRWAATRTGRPSSVRARLHSSLAARYVCSGRSAGGTPPRTSVKASCSHASGSSAPNARAMYSTPAVYCARFRSGCSSSVSRHGSASSGSSTRTSPTGAPSRGRAESLEGALSAWLRSRRRVRRLLRGCGAVGETRGRVRRSRGHLASSAIRNTTRKCPPSTLNSGSGSPRSRMRAIISGIPMPRLS